MKLLLRRISKPVAPWIALGAVLVAFLCHLVSLNPAGYFGIFHDDAIYLTSARSLAEGKGYKLPSLPNVPAETKYPILYAWLLSWIWRIHPEFPANVSLAVALTAVFACWFLLVAYLSLRRLIGLGEWPALGLVALTAFHPSFLLLSGAVLAHVPFMALALTAALIADAALRRNGRLATALVAGGMAGLAVMTRTIGVAVVVGLVAAGLHRRAFRQLLVVLLASAPFAAVNLSSVPVPPPSGPLGWVQSWLYYTSYIGFWKQGVPNIQVFQSMLQGNLKEFLLSPASLVLFPPLGGTHSYPGVLLCITLSVGILIGIIRQGCAQEWRPIHFIFVFYAPVAILWNFSMMEVLLLPFLPFFYAGLFVEGKHFVRMLIASFRTRQRALERALAAVLAVVAIAFVGLATAEYFGPFRSNIGVLAGQQTSSRPERQEFYDWARNHTYPQDRFVAWEDVTLYLFTGRQAIRPMAFSTIIHYVNDREVMEQQLAHMTDTARQIRARYWVVAENDEYSPWRNPSIRAWMDRFKSVTPKVFRSSRGKVEVYDLSCVQDPEQEGCEAAAAFVSQESLATLSRRGPARLGGPVVHRP